MPTPLEHFYMDSKNMTTAPDAAVFAIGTDNEHVSPLLDGVKDLAAAGVVPLSLSRHLVLTKAKWTKTANIDWLKDVLDAPATKTGHLFHPKAVAGLNAAAKGGTSVTADDFVAKYTGGKNATFDEVVMALKAGFTQVKIVDRGHAILTKP